ncbi:protein of unknown function [Beijerinckiaceae bacterium RH AL1]|nr:hypothetical protein [Beijerinckiaceae bacterium]VVB47436.1 protein of unknown function [Beijerinckiaceae bacterium RH CH11]VVB47518.1 protein of unknown function [Beijerinckiaceae bacterium RH AL8]VVC55888.1 protein of unknown function [Beijerinckiaceae bacterium RH AL1]
MFFQALTDAPTLREGVTLNFMAVPQEEGETPAKIAAGDHVTLRFGHCCPLIREGRITQASCEAATLSFEGSVWALVPRTSGVEIPGIVSEDWVITHRTA